MGSFDNATLMCKRALSYLKVAEQAFNSGYYDVSSTNCEISAELLIKSTYLLLGYSYPESHSIRKLLSQLSLLVPELKEDISTFIKERRKDLNQVELSRFKGQSSLIDVGADFASDCLATLKEYLIPLIKKICGQVV
ncbi:MAG: HEPN domain-containing protein [Metallosphaera sp.]